MFVGIAREQGIDARIVTLNGHVVATAEVAPGYWHIFDPDLGVHIAASLKTAEQNKLLLLDRYNAAPGWGSLPSAQREAVIATYLTPEDNHIDSLGRESYHSGWRIWGLHHSEVERLANVAKWALPLSMVAQASLLWLLLMKLTRRSSNGSKSQ